MLLGGSLSDRVALRAKPFCSNKVIFSDGFALQEYHDNIGDLDGPEEKERAQARAKEIIAVL